MTQIVPMRYRPQAAGLERWFGSLEAEIMAHIWQVGRPRTVKQVWRALSEQGKERSYTTIMTTMFRLADKGLLNRTRAARDIAHMYTQTCTQAEFIELQERVIMSSLERVRSA